MTAVAQNGKSLQQASALLQNDKDVLIIAYSQNRESLQFASEELQIETWFTE